MNIRTRFYKCCAMMIVVLFVATNVAAQTFSGQFAQANGEITGRTIETAYAGTPGAVQLAAAIGIVKPKPKEKPEADTPEEPPAQQTPPPIVEESVAVEQSQTSQTASKGVSKLTIGIGVGLAALLAVVAGGGGGGSSTPPSHVP